MAGFFYDPFSDYEDRLEREAEAHEHGFDCWADYIQALQDDNADCECKALIEEL